MNKVLVVLFIAILVSSCVAPQPASQPAPSPRPASSPQDIGKIAPEQEIIAEAKPATAEPTPRSAQNHLITIQRYEFSPKLLTIRLGDSVTWRNLGKTQHEVMGLGFQSAPLFQNDEFTHTFTQKGNHTYNSARYTATQGKIIVE